ncbi:hypothetical protein ACRQV7_06500 [Caproiciproducens sp. R2]|uniref:hypothetical protein n=1 Tax=Caproiciproducens sp. R2 TaxID=3435187 RepID=UPI0040337CCD
MKLFFSKQVKRFVGLVIVVCLLVAALFNAAGYFFHCKYISVAAAVAEVDQYEVRTRLLMDAMDRVGVCAPESAAVVWADGLKSRSGAMQYSVMDSKLKKEYVKQLDQYNPNWVTGMSSPWIESYKITNQTQTGSDQYSIRLSFSTATSGGPAGDYNAALTVVKDGDFWRITKISADVGLHPYMGVL